EPDLTPIWKHLRIFSRSILRLPAAESADCEQSPRRTLERRQVEDRLEDSTPSIPGPSAQCRRPPLPLAHGVGARLPDPAGASDCSVSGGRHDRHFCAACCAKTSQRYLKFSASSHLN